MERFWRAVRLFLLVALFATSGPAFAQSVQGELVDNKFGQPVPDVHLTLVVTGSRTGPTTLTDENGDFILTADSAGTYRVRAQKAGFRPILSNPVQLALGDTLHVSIRLLDSVIILDSVEVEGGRSRPMLARAFYERMAQGAFGVFITREDVVNAKARRTTDLLRTVPGFQFSPGRGDGFNAVHRGGCVPTVYIDGTRASLTNMTMDDLVQPSDIEGIEIYRTLSEAPPQYRGLNAGCSAILVWTRIGRGR